jgi:hypothetical protein
MTWGSVKNFPPRLPIFFKYESIAAPLYTAVQTIGNKGSTGIAAQL